MIEDKRIRVIVADDHPIVRRGIAELINETPRIQVVAEAVDGTDALGACLDLDPDVLVVDLRMPGLSGIEVTNILAARRPAIRVLVLTTFENDTDIQGAIKAGATGYLLKASSPSSIIAAIEAVAAGQTVLGPTIATRLSRHSQSGVSMQPSSPPLPSKREIQILELLQNGKTNSQIAYALALSQHTVNTHIRRIFGKLEAKNRTHAVKLARQHGWLGSGQE